MVKITPRLALLLTLPPLLWAGNAVVGRMAVGSVPPLMLNAMRWVLASLLLLPLGWRAFGSAAAREQVRERWRELGLLSLLGVGSYNALQYLALTTSTPLNVTLIAASSPLWMMGIGALFYRERPRVREWWGAALSLAGVVVVLSRGDLATLARVHFVVGDLLMLLAVLSWAFYSWLLARPPASLRGEARPAWNWAEALMAQLMFGARSPATVACAWNWAEALLVQTVLGSLWAGAGALGEAAVSSAELHWTPFVALALLYVAVGPSVVAYRCWGLGVTVVGPAIAEFFSNLTPLFAAVLSAALLHEPPQAYHGLAFALIVAGIAVSSRR